MRIKFPYIYGRNRDISIRSLASLLVLLVGALLLGGCSTTKRLGPGETLYNGSYFKFYSTEGEKIPSDVESEIIKAVDVKPNNAIPFIQPYRRFPFPLGLWVYNAKGDSAKGLIRWFANQMISTPVLISDVRPESRVKAIETILDNNGFFRSKASFKLQPKKNPKIANVIYDIDVADPYLIDSIIYLNGKSSESRFIDSVARKSSYLVKGERFCIDSLADVRINIANAMRNRGYYYFKPDYIEFLADTLITPQRVALKLVLADNMPDIARRQFRTGNITTYILRRSTNHPGTPDTIDTRKGDLIVMRPARLRPNMITSAITFREGKLFSVRDMDRTQERLARLGIFGNIQLQAVPADTSSVNPTLDLYITCQFQRSMEASVEANVTSKSNSYLGPGLTLGLTHNNLFGGAERLSIKLTGSYEWQTGTGHSNLMNSYEFGLQGSLAFPRLLAPKFVRRTNSELNWTTINLGADLLNRPAFFKMAEFSTGISYEWNYSRRVTNQFTPFKLTYAKLLSTTHDFDSVMAQNPAVALSFESQFIPAMSYSYNYSRWFERAHNNGVNFTLNLMEGGNVFWGLWRLFGVKGKKTIFGIPFSQFVKAQAQVVYSRRLLAGRDQWLVSRLLVGAEHAYGNSSEVPYAEQFYIGGANSIRAFTVRSLGPGSYRPPRAAANGYFDQTGSFKLEANCEYRFPIVSILHGALFVDAGNIWLLKKDDLRPGGLLTAKDFWRDVALGTGVGLRVDIGMMVIRGDLGYGLHAPYSTGRPGYFNILPRSAFAFHLAIGYPF
ncbi:MAG: BamA/TamA family outer membrane protein [Bacteroides sp.]|nr:BamA/TamA family outer membrane protein [Bacteroides sp.]